MHKELRKPNTLIATTCVRKLSKTASIGPETFADSSKLFDQNHLEESGLFIIFADFPIVFGVFVFGPCFEF